MKIRHWLSSTGIDVVMRRLFGCDHRSVPVPVVFAYFSTEPNQCFYCLKRDVEAGCA